MANPFSYITDMMGITTPEPEQPMAVPTPMPGMSTGSGYPIERQAYDSGLIGLWDKIMGTPTADQIGARYAQENRNTAEGNRRLDMDAQNNIIKRVNELRTENKDEQPHQTFKRAFNDPAILAQMHRVPPETMQALVKSMSEATQEPVKTTVVPNAAIALTQNVHSGKQVGTAIQNPDDKIQFNNWLIQQSDEDLLKLAQAQGMLKRATTDSDIEQATNRLMSAGKMTPEVRDKLIAKTIKMVSVPLGNGQTMEMVVDYTDPVNTKVLWKGASEQSPATPIGGAPSLGVPGAPPAPPAAPPAPPAAAPPAAAVPPPAAPPGPAATPPAPGPTPAPIAPALIPPKPAFTQPGSSLPPGSTPPWPTTPQGTPIVPRMPNLQPEPDGTPERPLPPPAARDPIEPWDARKKVLADPASMHDVAGFARGGVTALGRFAGNFGKFANYNAEASAKQDALTWYNDALNDALKEGRELKADAKTRAALQAGVMRVDENPVTSLNRQLAVVENLTRERMDIIKDLQAKKKDGSDVLSPSSPRRGQLDRKLSEINNVLAAAPSISQLRIKQRQYYEDGVPDLFTGIPSGREVLKEGQKQGTKLRDRIAPTQPKGTLSPADANIPTPEAIGQMDRKGLEALNADLDQRGVNTKGTRDLIIKRAKELLAEEDAKAKELKRRPQ